ncbi:MAG: anaerobic glycerol-3-phosphate dehydrogenase subunit GlpC [Muribaculaceae bacterium]
MTPHQNISENNFEQCLKCSICTVYCPVLAVRPEYPGPKQAGPDGERYRLKDPKFYDEALKYCLNCKRCEGACPSGVKIADIIQLARIKYSKTRPGLREIMLANTDFMGQMATRMAPVVNLSLGIKPVKLALQTFMGISAHATFPKYARQKFVNWYKKNAAELQGQYAEQVSYFHGCYVNYNFPKLGRDLLKIMNAIGYGVQLLNKEKCCGVALIANSQPKQARKQGEVNIAAIRQAKQQGMVTLTTSSTCTFTMRQEYDHLLGIDNADVKDSILLATKFIYDLVESGKVKLAFNPNYTRRIAYHTPCHMEQLGWAIYSTALLRMIPGVQLTMLPSQCCGIGGTYGFKKENHHYSQQIGAPLFEHINQSNCQLVATDCETCRWQIEMNTSLPVENPISIIADALNVEETMLLNRNSHNPINNL